MYIIDFFKSAFKKNNIGVLIWIIINAILITLIFGFFLIDTGMPEWAGFLIGFAVYLVSISIALSPVGEFILRVQQGCKKITDPALLARLQPLFDEVHASAMVETPNLERKVQFFMCDDMAPNAFATGRNTVCITRGLLAFSDEEIKGTLAHEFGHLAHKDTDTLLVVQVGNMIVSAIFVIWRVIFRVVSWFFTVVIGFVSESFGAIIASAITRVFIDALLGAAMWLWTKLGVLICLSSSRSNEYLADRFAYDIGYGNQLCSVFSKLGAGETSKGLWATLNSTHPATADRVAKLREYAMNGASAY